MTISVPGARPKYWCLATGLLVLCLEFAGCGGVQTDEIHKIQDQLSEIDNGVNHLTVSAPGPSPDDAKQVEELRHASGQQRNTIKQLDRRVAAETAETDRLEIVVTRLQRQILALSKYGPQLDAAPKDESANSAEIVKIERSVSDIKKQLAAIPNYDPRFDAMRTQISDSASQILASIRALPQPQKKSFTDWFRDPDIVIYDTYLCVTEILIIFLGICLLWGALSVASLVLDRLYTALSNRALAIRKTVKRYWQRFAPRSTIPVLVLCLSAFLLSRGMAFGASPDAAATPDLWDNPAFHEAMTTLWTAPLTILAIVFAVAGIAGLQGYRDIKQRLESELEKKISAVVDMAIGISNRDSAYYAWELAENLINNPRLDDHLPPWNLMHNSNASAHLKFAKEASELALRYLDRVPDNLEIRAIGQSNKYLRLQTGQSYAYYVAMSYEDTQYPSQEDWARALDCSSEAYRALTRPDWLEKEPKVTIPRVMYAWTDTFFYVRVLYAAKIARDRNISLSSPAARRLELERAVQNHETARTGFEEAVFLYNKITRNPELYDLRIYQPVLDRFRTSLG
jgi:hypothetical protein